MQNMTNGILIFSGMMVRYNVLQFIAIRCLNIMYVLILLQKSLVSGALIMVSPLLREGQVSTGMLN